MQLELNFPPAQENAHLSAQKNIHNLMNECFSNLYSLLIWSQILMIPISTTH